ncbi:SDR family NAD(P)-dependent oxidoreductase [Streptomyces sp. L7]
MKDRVYVVTGATRGLGNAAARELVADGAKVVVTGRDEQRAADAAAELGPNALGVAVDNADAEAPARLITAARDHFGGFDGILVSVGGPPPGVRRGHHRRAVAGLVRVGVPGRGTARAARRPRSWRRAGSSASCCPCSVHEPIPG